MLHFVRIGLAAALWTLSVALMIVRTVDYENTRLAALTGWAVLIGMVACVVTGWCLLAHERHRIREIAEITAAECQRQLKLVD